MQSVMECKQKGFICGRAAVGCSGLFYLPWLDGMSDLQPHCGLKSSKHPYCRHRFLKIS